MLQDITLDLHTVDLNDLYFFIIFINFIMVNLILLC